MADHNYGGESTFSRLFTRLKTLLGGYLRADQLQTAVNDALAQAKESGEFDGAPGDDYILTDADKAEIAGEVKNSFATEEWTFTLEDGSEVTKKVVLG